MEIETPFGSIDFETGPDDFIPLKFDGEVNAYLIRIKDLRETLDFVAKKPFADKNFNDTVVNNLTEEVKYIEEALQMIFKEIIEVEKGDAE